MAKELFGNIGAMTKQSGKESRKSYAALRVDSAALAHNAAWR